jgi:hypothetical protein
MPVPSKTNSRFPEAYGARKALHMRVARYRLALEIYSQQTDWPKRIQIVAGILAILGTLILARWFDVNPN